VFSLIFSFLIVRAKHLETSFLKIPISGIQILNEKVLDLKLIVRGHRSADPRLGIIVVDEKSINRYGRWPWSRTVFSKLTNKLKKLGVKVLAFDLVFSELEGIEALKALEKLHREIPNQKFKNSIKKTIDSVDGDALFSKSIKSFNEQGALILGFFTLLEEGNGSNLKSKSTSSIDILSESELSAMIPESMENFWKTRWKKSQKNQRAVRVTQNKISNSTPHFGFFSNDPDSDGIFRSYALFDQIQGKFYPSLALKAVEKYMDDFAFVQVNEDMGMEIHFSSNEIVIPIESPKVRLNYYGKSKTFPHFSVADILDSSDQITYQVRDLEGKLIIKTKNKREVLREKMLFIGTTATGINDMRNTPFEGYYPGVEAHVTAADNLLNQNLLLGSVSGLLWGFAITFIGTLIFGLVLLNLEAVWGFLFFLFPQPTNSKTAIILTKGNIPSV